ncbi:MAG: site-2 protease family protein [Candidatus Velthaea sp.]
MGRLFDIRVGVHVSWIAVYAFMTVTIARAFAEVPREVAYGLGAACALALFASVVVHEFAHALTARRYGLTTRAITLFLFGGVATLDEEPQSPRAEVAIALAGPIASAVLAAAAFAALVPLERFGSGPLAAPLATLVAYLAAANGVLAAFNLIPAFPMDGGRVLRAVLWRRRKDRSSATVTAALAGVVFAAALAGAGLFAVARLHSWEFVWYGFVGVFLLRQGWVQYRDAASVAGRANALKAAAASH